MKNKILHWSATLAVAVALSVGIGYLFAWTGPMTGTPTCMTPGATPPDCNVPAPINVGSVDQTKTGDVCTTKDGPTKCLSDAGNQMNGITTAMALLTRSYYFNATNYFNTGGNAASNYRPVDGVPPHMDPANYASLSSYQSVDTKPFTGGETAAAILLKVHCVETWVYILNPELTVPGVYASNFAGKQYDPSIACYATDNRSVVQDIVVKPDANGFIQWRFHDVDPDTYYAVVYVLGYWSKN